MKLSQLLDGVDVLSVHADTEMEIGGVCDDSRLVKPGDIFVAVDGFETDGHRFIPQAVEKGAAALLCSRVPETEAYVLVGDTRRALALTAANFFGRPGDSMRLIGVTGTNGKTTVTYLLKAILEKAGAKVGLIGTNRNMIGSESFETERTTPGAPELQSLLARMRDAGCGFVVMEVSSHALALDRVAGLRFEVGVFTNLTQDHLDFHKDMEDYFQAKARLFEISDKAVVNLDDPASARILERASGEKLSFSASRDQAGLTAKNIVLGQDRVRFDAVGMQQIHRIELGIPGAFSVCNALAACGAAMMLGLSLEDCAEALREAGGVKGRVEVVPTGTDYTVLIDYAHSPDGLSSLLDCVQGFAEGRVMLLFGCGGDRDPVKRPLMGKIAVEKADFVIVTSDNPRTEAPGEIIKDILGGMAGTKTPYIVIEDRREAIRWALDNAAAKDVVVLAGKGHETYQIIGKTKTHLDEREEIAEHLGLAFGIKRSD